MVSINEDFEVCRYHVKETMTEYETPWAYWPPSALLPRPRRTSMAGLRPLDPVDPAVELQVDVIAEPGLNFVDEPPIAEIYHGRPAAVEGASAEERMAAERRADMASVAQRSRRAHELRPTGGETFLIDDTTDLEAGDPVSPADAPAAAAGSSQMEPHLLGTTNDAILRDYLGRRGDEAVYTIAKAATDELQARKQAAAEKAAMIKRLHDIQDAREAMSKSMAAVTTADNSAAVVVQTAWQTVAAKEAAVAEEARRRAAAVEAAEEARLQNVTSKEKERALSAARRVRLVAASVVQADLEREEQEKRAQRIAASARMKAWNEKEELAALRAKLALAAAEKANVERRRKEEENAKTNSENAERARQSLERQKHLRQVKEEADKKYEQDLGDEVLPYLMWFLLSCGVYKHDFNDVVSRPPIVRPHRVTEFCFPHPTHCRNHFGFPCSRSDPQNILFPASFSFPKGAA